MKTLMEALIAALVDKRHTVYVEHESGEWYRAEWDQVDGRRIIAWRQYEDGHWGPDLGGNCWTGAVRDSNAG